MITKLQIEHYNKKIKDMLKPQIEIIKLSLQDKRQKLVEETKKTLSKKMGIDKKIKLIEKQDDEYHKMKRRHEKEAQEMDSKKLKLDKQIRKFFEGKTERDFFSRNSVNKEEIFDCLDDMAENYADSRAKLCQNLIK